MAASDPTFGPPLITLANGTTSRTRWRRPTASSSRLAARVRSWAIGSRSSTSNLARSSTSEAARNFEVATNIFNVFNTSKSWLFNYYGGEYDYNPNHLQPFVRANPLSANLSLTYRF